MSELVTATNGYLQSDRNLIKVPLVRSISKYVFKILKTFGIYDEDVVPPTSTGHDSHASYEETIAPLMNVLSKFRDEMKERTD